MCNGVVLAESDNTIIIEGNHYFPLDSVNREYLTKSTTHTTCPWKGLASYYDMVVKGKDYIAFWKGNKVQ
jgi:uncharacterized protein (DUF427 family)